MTVVETDEFLRKAKPLMSDLEREELVAFLAANPAAGKIVAETGGVRKVRWGLAGRGKRAVRGSFTTTIANGCRYSC